MNTPLGVRTLHQFGARHFATSRVGDYDGHHIQWRSYADIDAGSARLANVLQQLGLVTGDRVGTFMWNSTHHLEAYLAIPSAGGVLHTLNCRLSPEHIGYIIEHASDRFVLLDGRLVETFQPVLPMIPSVEHVIVVGTREQTEQLNDARAMHYEWWSREPLMRSTGPYQKKMRRPAFATPVAQRVIPKAWRTAKKPLICMRWRPVRSTALRSRNATRF